MSFLSYKSEHQKHGEEDTKETHFRKSEINWDLISYPDLTCACTARF